MKRIFRYSLLGLTAALAVFTSACDDFFDTDPDNILNVNDYISSENEMYRGFLGIITRMQNAGDHPIFLTDTRCNFLEIAPNAPVALQNIYNYEPTDGNEYADPTCYYEIITACNDYFDKMSEYQQKIGSSMSETAAADFPKLVSSALRIKVWAYYTLGRIYGKAIYFDDALEEIKDLSDAKTFTPLNSMYEVADKCIEMLDNGITLANGNHFAADLEMDWPAWIDPETQNTAYDYWNYLTPPWLLMRAELMSWRASYTNSQADWQWIRDNILEYLNNLYLNVDGSVPADKTPDYYYNLCIPLTHNYYNIFFSEQVGYDYQLICGIMYDYNNGQRNRLVQYFCPAYPGDGFYLQPSQYGMDSYAETDIRSYTQLLTMYPINGSIAFTSIITVVKVEQLPSICAPIFLRYSLPLSCIAGMIIISCWPKPKITWGIGIRPRLFSIMDLKMSLPKAVSTVCLLKTVGTLGITLGLEHLAVMATWVLWVVPLVPNTTCLCPMKTETFM